MSDDTRTGGAAGSESTLDTPSSGLPTSSTSAPPENGTRGETADLRADALADAGSYVPGSDGVTESGTIVIDCSTAIPSSTVKIAERVAAADGQFLDAAMTRTPKEAAEGRLNLIVGAPDELFRDVLPLLQDFAENITHGGPVGSGHKLKLLHNYVSLGFTAVLAEASSAARHAGIADDVFLEVLGNGGGAGVVLERLRPFIAADDPSGFRFSLANTLKDVGYYNAMAEDVKAPHRVAKAIEALYREVNDHGHGDRLAPELIRILEKS